MTKEILEVYCEKCWENFNSENVWDAIEYNEIIICVNCFNQLENKSGEISHVNFRE